jgi:hypothetical protein
MDAFDHRFALSRPALATALLLPLLWTLFGG